MEFFHEVLGIEVGLWGFKLEFFFPILFRLLIILLIFVFFRSLPLGFLCRRVCFICLLNYLFSPLSALCLLFNLLAIFCGLTLLSVPLFA